LGGTECLDLVFAILLTGDCVPTKRPSGQAIVRAHRSQRPPPPRPQRTAELANTLDAQICWKCGKPGSPHHFIPTPTPPQASITVDCPCRDDCPILRRGYYCRRTSSMYELRSRGRRWGTSVCCARSAKNNALKSLRSAGGQSQATLSTSVSPLKMRDDAPIAAGPLFDGPRFDQANH
jgi:hypothetical protein